MTGEFVIVFFTALAVSMLFTPMFARLALKHGIVDRPGPRRVNKRVIARLGGPTMFLGFMVATALEMGRIDSWPGIVLGATLVFTVGLIDDVHSLRHGIKLVVQIVAASVAFYFGVRIEYISNPMGGYLFSFQNTLWISYFITVFWIVAVTNAINLIDGLDGLAAGIVCIASFTFFLVALQMERETSAILALAMAGSTGGFLRWNFYPAKVFMGDSGAYFLGFMIAVIAIIGAFKSTIAVTLLIPVLILGLPIFDTSFAILRRYQSKKPIMASADKGHLHHRLLAAGVQHRMAVIICYVVTFVLSALSLLLINAWALAFFLLAAIAGLTLLLIVAGKIFKKRKENDQ